MNFSDKKHYPHAITFHGAEEIDFEQACKQEVIDALQAWQGRSSPLSPGLDQLRIEDCPHFSISYDGVASHYWPSEPDNDISETLVREFLFHNGICSLTEPRAHLFHVRYTFISMTGEDCLLVCPFLTAANNIRGIVVVTVTKQIQPSFIQKMIV